MRLVGTAEDHAMEDMENSFNRIRTLITSRKRSAEMDVLRFLNTVHGNGSEIELLKLCLLGHVAVTMWRNQEAGIRRKLLRRMAIAWVQAEKKSRMRHSMRQDHIGYSFLVDDAWLSREYGQVVYWCREASIEGWQGDWMGIVSEAKRRKRRMR